MAHSTSVIPISVKSIESTKLVSNKSERFSNPNSMMRLLYCPKPTRAMNWITSWCCGGTDCCAGVGDTGWWCCGGGTGAGGGKLLIGDIGGLIELFVVFRDPMLGEFTCEELM
mmetsp:Transcript_11746/g.14184  ORF Transcript_11746/g.14184 Transcript_11746/m.14184 type:complete len:113 (-) Transcript_11746:1141-1479(-)